MRVLLGLVDLQSVSNDTGIESLVRLLSDSRQTPTPEDRDGGL